MKRAFTLAEVLITLAIIGVVAAITIPTLIQNYKKKVASTRLKTFYSTIKQAAAMSELENGPISSWNYEQVERDENNKMILSDRIDKGNAFAEKYILPYVKYMDIKEVPLWSYLDYDASIPAIFFPDGSAMTILSGGTNINIFYDINGVQKPNELGRDQFNFNVYKELGIIDTYGVNLNDITKEAFLIRCTNNKVYCSTLLRLNNWEFSEDYPYEL